MPPHLYLPPPTSCCTIRPAWKTRAWMRHFSPRLQTIQHPTVTWGKAFGVHRVIFACFLLLSLYLSEAYTHTHAHTNTHRVCSWTSCRQPDRSSYTWVYPVGNKPWTYLCKLALQNICNLEVNETNVHFNLFTRVEFSFVYT